MIRAALPLRTEIGENEMTKRTVIVILMLCLLVSIAGCTKAKPAEEPAAGASTPVPTLAPAEPTTAPPVVVPPTDVPPTKAPAVVLPTKAPVPTSAEKQEMQGAGPVLLAPADGAKDKLFDLMWQWDAELGADEWFELQVWPAKEGAEPEVFAWTKAKSVHLTAANLLPGTYTWQVAVVQGRDEGSGRCMRW